MPCERPQEFKINKCRGRIAMRPYCYGMLTNKDAIIAKDYEKLMHLIGAEKENS